MAISSVIEKHGMILIYDEKGNVRVSIPKGSGPKDGLQGYTATTVNIRRGNIINVHNEKGEIVRGIVAI